MLTPISARQISGAFDFDLGLPTTNQAPLQPIKSGRGRPRKTPQRASLPPPSSKKTPRAPKSLKGGQASKSSSSNNSKRLRSFTNAETTKTDSVRGVRSSSQPTRSDDSGRVTKKRRVNGVANEATSIEVVGQTENGLPDIQESLQEDAVLEPLVPTLIADQHDEIGTESSLASKAPAKRKRKKRKSVTMQPRKRVSVGMTIPLEKVGEDLNDTNEPEPIAEEPIAQENEVLREINDNVSNRGGLPRRRKKRKSIVTATKSKKKAASPLQQRTSAAGNTGHSSSAQSARQESQGRQTNEELLAHQEADCLAPTTQEEGTKQPISAPRRRGRPPGSGKVSDRSTKITPKGAQQASTVPDEAVRVDKSASLSVAKRRGRPPGSGKATLAAPKASKASLSKQERTAPGASQKPQSRKSKLEIVKEKHKSLPKGTDKTLEKKSRKKPKVAKRSADSIPITAHQGSRTAQLNTSDVLGKVCDDIIDENLEGLEAEAENAARKTTKGGLKKKHKVAQASKKNLEGTRSQTTEAIDHNAALKKRLRQVRKGKATAREDLLCIRNEVEEVVVEMDLAHMEDEETSTQNKVLVPWTFITLL